MASPGSFTVQGEGLRTYYRVRSENRVLYITFLVRYESFQAQAGISGIDWVTTMVQKDPCRFLGQGSNITFTFHYSLTSYSSSSLLEPISLPRTTGAFTSRDLQTRSYRMDGSPLPLLKKHYSPLISTFTFEINLSCPRFLVSAPFLHLICYLRVGMEGVT